MNLTPNKICLTQKGLEFVNEEREQLNEQNSTQVASFSRHNQSMSRTSSLPLLKSHSLLNQPKLVKQLSSMSRTKLKLDKIGLKNMGEKRADDLVRKKLNQQFYDSNNYVKSIIPHLVKMTKEKNNNTQLQSRFQRARMYVARLQQNFNTKFVFRPKKNPEQTL